MSTRKIRSISEGQGPPRLTARAVNGQPADADGAEEKPRQRWSTAYERLAYDLMTDDRCLKEVTLGRRIGFYRIRGELGVGNFSQVRMGIHSLTKEKVAIKILDKTKLDQKTQRLLSREISSMERLHHANIIRLYEVVETLAKLHLVMEYAGGGELFTKISNEGRLPEADARVIFAQIVAAVDHMHQNSVIHRDLKAENVFLAGLRTIKVGDFGFSIVSSVDEALSTFCGSPPYAAPELFRDEHYLGVWVDVWALGILLYFMLTGVMPFRAETVSKLKRHILDGAFTIPAYVSAGLQELIRDILRPDPLQRLSIAGIKRCTCLGGERFPEPLERYPLSPTVDGRPLSDDQIETRRALQDLGIGDEQLRAAHGKQSRSSITGTYRIVLHQIQRRSVLDPPDPLTDGGAGGSGDKENDGRVAMSSMRRPAPSRLCVVL